MKGVERGEGEGGRGSHMRVESCTVPYPYVRRDGDEIKVKPRNEQRRQLEGHHNTSSSFSIFQAYCRRRKKKRKPMSKNVGDTVLIGGDNRQLECAYVLYSEPDPDPQTQTQP